MREPRRWTIYVCPDCGLVAPHGAVECVAHGLLTDRPAPYPEPVEVVEATRADAPRP